MSVSVVSTLLERETPITTASEVDQLLNLITPLIKDPSGEEEVIAIAEENKEEFEEEQGLVARLVHFFKVRCGKDFATV
jgi:hypothetical protein